MEPIYHTLYQIILIASIAVNAKFIAADNLNNIYVVNKENTLVKYDSTGKKLFSFNNPKYGDITSVDVNDPFKPMIYYESSQVIINTDNTLSLVNEILLRNDNSITASSVCRSSDNNIWLYDIRNVKLTKINNNGNVLMESNELQSTLGFVPEPCMMIENNQKIFLCDSVYGIIIYDEYGNHERTISIKGIKYFQVVNESVFYTLKNNLFEYNYKTLEVNEFPLNQSIQFSQALISNRNLLLLQEDNVSLYNLKKE